MSLMLLISALILLAIPLALIALRLLLNIPVLKHFLVGCVALFCGLLALTALFSAWDLYSYRALLKETPVATVTFSQRAPQQFYADLKIDEAEFRYPLFGDQWQMDVRMIKWDSLIARLGVAPVFRLDRLAGRYESIEDERNKPRSVHALASSDALDVWHWLRKSDSILKLADAEYGSATYLPMADGATFEIHISSFGLIARPANRPAAEAVAQWSS